MITCKQASILFHKGHLTVPSDTGECIILAAGYTAINVSGKIHSGQLSILFTGPGVSNKRQIVFTNENTEHFPIPDHSSYIHFQMENINENVHEYGKIAFELV